MAYLLTSLGVKVNGKFNHQFQQALIASMKLAIFILLFCLVFFPWLVISLKSTWTVFKLENSNTEINKLKTVALIWLMPFYGAYLASKKAPIDWGKANYDNAGDGYGDWGGDGC